MTTFDDRAAGRRPEMTRRGPTVAQIAQALHESRTSASYAADTASADPRLERAWRRLEGGCRWTN